MVMKTQNVKSNKYHRWSVSYIPKKENKSIPPTSLGDTGRMIYNIDSLVTRIFPPHGFPFLDFDVRNEKGKQKMLKPTRNWNKRTEHKQVAHSIKTVYRYMYVWKSFIFQFTRNTHQSEMIIITFHIKKLQFYRTVIFHCSLFCCFRLFECEPN